MQDADYTAEQPKRHRRDITFRDRLRCFLSGHDATYGTLFGWCQRCQHSVHTADRRTVLSYGEFYRFPPAHKDG